MNEQPIPVGMQYAYEILHMWIDICEVAQEFRQNLLTGEINPDCTAAYISKLTRLWIELLPKIKGINDKTFEAEFRAFEPEYFDPDKLLLLKSNEEEKGDKGEDPFKLERLFKLELVLRTALEKLRITDFES